MVHPSYATASMRTLLHVLTQLKPIVLTRVWDDWEMFRIKVPAPQQLLALTKTCKAINDETQQLFYAANTFELMSSLHSGCWGANDLKAFRRCIGKKNSAALRSIVVQAGFVDLYNVRITSLDGNFGRYVHTLVVEAEKNAACVVKIHFILAWANDQGNPRRGNVRLDLNVSALTAHSWDAVESAVCAEYGRPSYGSRVLPRNLRTLDVWKRQIRGEAPDKGHHGTTTE